MQKIMNLISSLDTKYLQMRSLFLSCKYFLHGYKNFHRVNTKLGLKGTHTLLHHEHNLQPSKLLLPILTAEVAVVCGVAVQADWSRGVRHGDWVCLIGGVRGDPLVLTVVILHSGLRGRGLVSKFQTYMLYRFMQFLMQLDSFFYYLKKWTFCLKIIYRYS